MRTATTLTARFGRILAVAAIAALTVGAQGCLFYEEPVVVYDPAPTPPPPPPPPAPVIYTGDLAVSYDFGGWSCWDMGVASVAFELYDESGWLVSEDWGLPCAPGSTIWITNLPLGDYYLVLEGADGWGYPTFTSEAYVGHYSPTSSVWVTLY
jgi:hypothetical protein